MVYHFDYKYKVDIFSLYSVLRAHIISMIETLTERNWFIIVVFYLIL